MEHIFCYNPECAVVTTTKGKVRGYVYDGVSIFKGIPYAKAARFHAPEPMEPWDDVMDTTSFGYVCPLLDSESKPNGELLVPHRYWIMNEDCQNLNVWTPACDGEKRPVLVWLHGGGYESGSAIEQIAYEGENMCRVGQVVVISINHRLNVLGYCDLSAFGKEYENSGNAGMDDIIAALQWIHANIEAFGGDPANVTVFGQSGGGAKVTTLLQMPAADGLFAKGINMSGVIGPVLSDAEGSGEELVRAMMAELGTDDVKTLETVPYAELAAAYKKVRPQLAAEGKNVGGRPYKNAYYAGEPAVNGFRAATAQVPLLVGSVFGEFTSFVPTPYAKSQMPKEEGEKAVKEYLGGDTAAAAELLALFEKAYPDRHPVDLLNLDFIFRAPEQEYIRKRSALNSSTYVYLFNYDLPVDGGRTPWHCADIPFVFHNTELVPMTQEAGVTEKLEEQIFQSVIAFARTGCPDNEAIPQWPASTPEEEHVMVFDTDTKVRTNYDAELIPMAAKYMGPILQQNMAKMMRNVQH